MEVPVWVFSTVWSIIGSYSLFIGTEKLDKTELSTSVSPVVMSAFKLFLAVAFFHSITYTLVVRTKLKIPVERYFIWITFAIFPIYLSFAGESVTWYFPMYYLFNLICLFYFFLPDMKSFFSEPFMYKVSISFAFSPILFRWISESSGWYLSIFFSNSMMFGTLKLAALSEEESCLIIHYMIMPGLSAFVEESFYFSILIILIGFFTSIAWAAMFGDERFQKWLPAASAAGENQFFLRLKKVMRENRKGIEFATGTAGTILFQNFFRLTTFDAVVAFLYLAVAWLANLALLLASHDLGVFNFFLTNVIVGCTVSEFGLRGNTWLAYGACVLLFIVRQKLESLRMVIKGEDQGAVVVWHSGETTTGQSDMEFSRIIDNA